jgi:predicted nucleic acid-binding protein
MRRLFADAFYWIALLHVGDQWHQRVVAFTATLGAHRLYTTDAVFDEFLAAYSARESYLRQRAATTVRRLLASPEVMVIHQTRELFLEGLTLYETRPDKEYSLTDCISMQTMRREGLTEVLTNDHHFAQEGFRILFP